ncbi:MAG: hypothetical protein JWP25_7249 [Bradyrhizobium sp.]|nr:hypothetical protein [Bradyrhizobium sp.]
MLDDVRVRNDRGVQHGLVLDLGGRLVGLLDDAVDRRTLRPAGLLAEFLEDLLKPLDPLVGLFPRWPFSPATRSRLVAFSIILGSDLTICCSA